MNDKLAGMISRVQKLINQAEYVEANGYVSASGVRDDESGARQAAHYRAMAERIMRDYRIEEEQLIASDPTAVGVVMHPLFAYNTSSQFEGAYSMMMYYIADHCGIEYAARWNTGDEDYGIWFDMFGYEGDLRQAEWLWSAARLVFASHLEPKIDPNASDQVNAYNLRQAGILRKDIARKLWGENTPANRSRAQRLYLAECKTRGEQPLLTGLGTDAVMYRESYANEFVSRLGQRLRAARNAVDSTGGTMTLHGRADRIKEALYAAYPRRRPQPRTDAAPVDNTPAKPAKPYRITKADERRWARQAGPSAEAGRMAGRGAANKVEVSRTHTPAQRLDS